MMKRLAVLGAAAVIAVASLSGTASAAGANTIHAQQTSPNGKISVVSIGVLNAAGRDVPLSNTRDKFVYPNGNILVTHHAASSDNHFNPDGCVFTSTERGSYVVTGGTGNYRGAEGGGTYVATVFARGCGNVPTKFLLTIDASGTLDLDR